jgi:outer membrane biosynthesis protein TonB
MKVISTIVSAAFLLLVFGGVLTMGASSGKVTICHATSSETNPWVELTISENAVYGPGGHFNENGTTQAGHEEDYFGPCNVESPTPTPTPDVTPTPTPEITPTPTPEVTPTPTPEVTPTPTPEITPRPTPVASGEPVPTPTPEPTPEPTPGVTLPPTDT